ncbi:MAG: hypothetical protein AAFY25_07570 [Pseudomonadota bacterium]
MAHGDLIWCDLKAYDQAVSGGSCKGLFRLSVQQARFVAAEVSDG